jgi:arabinan endo-1,5-alpha-L-arabinosidase
MRYHWLVGLALAGWLVAGVPATPAGGGRGGGPGAVGEPGPGGAGGPNAAALRQQLVELGSRGVRVHDPSTIIKCKDEYWLFYTGRGIPSFRSRDLVQWQPGPRTLNAALPWVAQAVPDNRNADCWAPDVVFVKDRYLLYFSVSTFGKSTSAIGLLSNPTLDPADPKYKWTDEGIVIQSPALENFNAIDPAIVNDPADGLWMVWGSFWDGIKLVQLDPATGKRLAPNSPIHSLARNNQIEAAYIHRNGEYYYLFVNWGQCCRGVQSTYNIRVGRSKKITGPYLDKEGRDLARNGGTLLLETEGPFIGPGHAGIIKVEDKYWFSCHFYDGSSPNGPGTLAIRPLEWDRDGWPRIGKTPAPK